MRDIIVFGTGQGGKNMLPFIEKDRRILFFTDNNQEKWGTVFGNYSVKPPGEIQKNNCDIVISTTAYESEIIGQLEQMGVCRERMYVSRKFQVQDTYGYEIIPVIEECLTGTEIPLVEYDLYHSRESETSSKKVLICCCSFSVYAKQLIENMSRRVSDVEFSLLTKAKEYKEKIISDQLKHIYCFQTMADLKTILETFPVYDAIQLLWMEREWSYFCRLMRKKTTRLNLNIGGSDFYRADKKKRDIKRELISYADRIIGQTADTVQNFVSYYGDVAADKMVLLPYGIEVLEFIDLFRSRNKNEIRRKYKIPPEKITITCGHNANSAHQHMAIIDAVNMLPEEIKKQIVCVFPMTYPQNTDAYVEDVQKRLQEVDFDSVVLTDFMDFEEMAEYALISDIMLHVQTTDQLSSTMLEEMYAGSVVIAGNWLPYKALHEMGIYFIDADSIAGVTSLLEDVVGNIEAYKTSCEGNREIVWKHSSWDELAPRWRALWD